MYRNHREDLDGNQENLPVMGGKEAEKILTSKETLKEERYG